MKKILVVSEASYLHTGYAVYCRHLLNGLRTKYEVAEFACYANPDDPRIHTVPWKLYCNEPSNHSQQEMDIYNSTPFNKFGAWKFEQVCLDFKPDIVISIRDFWMDGYIDSSPFRRFFKWIWLTTVDAEPQNHEWLDVYSRCDGVLTYNDWSAKVLLEQSGGKIKCYGSAPGGTSAEYVPLDRKKVKEQLGFDEDTKIIGTVMRNQKRKLYPDFFAGLRKYLDKTKSTNTFGYCHVSYPDSGWKIPELLKEYKLNSKILFTYCCKRDNNTNTGCGFVFPAFFSDAVTFCKRCGQLTATMSNVQNGASPQDMSLIYNLFDVYIQYASAEGLGVPQLEAASCGIPIISVDYSAMSDVCPKLGGLLVKPLALSTEIESGRKLAVPDNDDFVLKLEEILSKKPIEYEKLRAKTKLCQLTHYQWSKTIDKWIEVINSMGTSNNWNEPPRLHNIPICNVPDNVAVSIYVEWLLTEVLGEPERVGTYMGLRLIKDLLYGATLSDNGTPGGMNNGCFNESATIFSECKYVKFTKDMAYNYIAEFSKRKNIWEKRRCGIQ
jgi:glycosyltransferase involved in cell wall biosynthesis